MASLTRRSALLSVLLLAVVASCRAWGCGSDGQGSGPPVPASSDPEGNDLVVGAIVIATENTGGVRIYKLKETKYFPPPMGDEIVLLAFNEKGNDFAHAAALWHQRNLTVALENVRVPRSAFRKNRDYRVIATEPVTEAEKALKRDDKLPPK